MPGMERTILGIDPGTRIMGYGIIKAEGQRFSFVDMGVVNMTKEADPLIRLERVQEEVTHIIQLHHPDCLSIETPFYGKNVQSLIKLGRAQGVAIATGMALGVKVFEYAPLKIKQSLTGKGSASKEQVCAMVFRLLGLHMEQPKYLDATDAMAAAICHGIHCRFDDLKQTTRTLSAPGSSPLKSVKSKLKKANWAEFLSQHPDRIL